MAYAQKAGEASIVPPIMSYIDVFRASPDTRIEMIKMGVRATEAKRLIADLTLAQSAAFAALKLSAATINRKAARGETLPLDESERVIGMARLIGQILAMVEDSGRPDDFDAGAWMSQWLTEALPALGNRRPIDLLDTMEGQELVRSTLAKVQSGAYA